jgi:hypothetical protein
MQWMTRVLFYLPVVTPWWFDNIVAPLIRTLAVDSKVHILVAPLWRNTGIGPDQIAGCSAIPNLLWHIVDDPDHRSLRTSPTDPDGLVAFVRSIAPDYVFCRSADVATPSRFPGKVVQLLEAGAPPFAFPSDRIIFQRDFLHHGAMPMLDGADRHALDATFAGAWQRMRSRFDSQPPFCLSREAALEWMGLPRDRKIVALPLEYEHEEAFTGFHGPFTRNLDLIEHLADALDDDCVLAITDHPLNYRYIDNRPVYAMIEALGDRAHLVPNAVARYWPTTLLIQNCDGLVVRDTKALYAGAFFGKPTLRLSHRPTADWIGAHDDVASFLEDVRAGRGGARIDDASRWFAFHILHEVISPTEISSADILDRIDMPFSGDRLRAGLARFEAQQGEVDLAA